MSAQRSVVTRRGWLAAAVASAAAVGGAGLAWRRAQQQSRALSLVEEAFWQQQFNQLDGVALDMASFKGRPLVLNFWATWCPPCIEELPLLNGFFEKNKAKSWQVVGLAVDQLVPVKRFVTQSPMSFPIALAGFAGVELSRSLGNLSGGLPFTVVFGTDGAVTHRKMGKLTTDDLLAWERLKS